MKKILKQFKKIYLTIIITIALCTMLCSCKQKDNKKELLKFAEMYNENCSYKYNGSILIAKGDEVMLNEGYGTANYKLDIRNPSDSLFTIGSIADCQCNCSVFFTYQH